MTAILLAAGSSSRMGESKLLLPLAGKPLLVHSLETLRASRVREIVVVLGNGAERVRREIPFQGVRVILNEAYAEGMGSSIRAGLRAASRDAGAFLVVLGDQPLVRAATIDALVAQHEATHAVALVPTFRGVRGNPVLLDRALVPEMEAVRGDMGCRGVLQAHGAEVLEVPVPDPAIRLDVDTPQDLRRLDDALRQGVPLERLLPG